MFPIHAALNPQACTVVIVTYGNRKPYVEALLQALQPIPVQKIILVNNAATWKVEALLPSSVCPLEIISSSFNQGSAYGFFTGLQHALRSSAEMIWLLDDDLEPSLETFQQLTASYAQLSQTYPIELLAVLAFRPALHDALKAGIHPTLLYPRPSSFLGFHFLDIPLKLIRRWKNAQPNPSQALPSLLPLKDAPYGGLLFHRSLIQTIGLPRTEFILYEDDIEFTHRITDRGGKIFLATQAILQDRESTWTSGASQTYSNGFEKVLKNPSDLKTYYFMRNQTYFDVHGKHHSVLVFFINQWLYRGLLWCLSWIYGQRKRYQLLLRALHDGMEKKLGMPSDFQLE